MIINSCVHLQPFVLYLIISVHRTASWSSISLSLYWFLSISTLAISTLVKRFLCAVGTSLCGSTRLNPHITTLKYMYVYAVCVYCVQYMSAISDTVVQNTHVFFIFAFVFHFLHLKSHPGKDHLLSCCCVLLLFFSNLQAQRK